MELGRSQFDSTRPGSLPARTRDQGGALLQEGVGGTFGFKLYWARQDAPPPLPTNKAMTPRVELWELQSQVPWVGMRAGRPGWGLPGGDHPCPRTWPACTWAEAVPIDGE